MESIKNIHEAARILFFSTGFFFLFFAFLLHNGIAVAPVKFLIHLLDLPFLLFTITYFLTKFKLSLQGQFSILESFVVFFSLLAMAGIVFYHFAFPDLI